MTGNTVQSTIIQQKRYLSQPSAAVPPNVNPPSVTPLFTWEQIQKIQSVNHGEQGNYDYFSHDHPGGQ
jgi:hypothetical protein